MFRRSGSAHLVLRRGPVELKAGQRVVSVFTLQEEIDKIQAGSSEQTICLLCSKECTVES